MKLSKGRKWILALTLLVLPVPAEAQTDSASTFQTFEKLLGADMSALQIPGVAVAFVSNGRVVYSRGFGVSNIETQRAASPEMLFRVGSVTKPVAAYAIIAEARAHGVSLDAPIGRYLPRLTAKLRSVTLAQLLSHTAGMREEITAAPLHDHPDERELVTQLSTWTDTMLFAEPGDIYSYSNLGYVLAGAVVETIAHKPFAQIVADRVFKPLRITDATFSSRVATSHAYADGYNGERGTPPTLVTPIVTDARHLPPTMLWASAADLARFEIALIDHGRIEGRRALDSTVIDLMTTPRATMPSIPGGSYGYGLEVRDENGARRVLHGGRIDGYFATIEMSPATRRGFVLLSNRLDLGPTQALRAFVSAETGIANPTSNLQTRSIGVDVNEAVGHYGNGSWTFDVTDSAGVLLFHGRVSPTASAVVTRRLTPDGGLPFAIVHGARSNAIYFCTGLRAARKHS